MAACPSGLAQAGGGPPLALFAERGLDTRIGRLDPGRRGGSGRAGRASAGAARVTDRQPVRGGWWPRWRPTRLPSPPDVHAGPPRRPAAAGSAEHAAGAAAGSELGDRRQAAGLRGQPTASSWTACWSLPPGLQPGRTARSRLVTLVHGGPVLTACRPTAASPHDPARWLAAAGCAVFLPQSARRPTGHGRDVRRRRSLGRRSAAGGSGPTSSTGLDLLDRPTGSPTRPGWGSPARSHGGFMAAWAVGAVRPVPGRADGRRASRDWGDAWSAWATSAALRVQPERQLRLGGAGAAPRTTGSARSATFGPQCRTPVLIVHGARTTPTCRSARRSTSTGRWLSSGPSTS